MRRQQTAVVFLVFSFLVPAVAAPPPKSLPPMGEFGPTTPEEVAAIKLEMARIQAAYVPGPRYELPEILQTKAVGPIKRRIRQSLEKAAGLKKLPEPEACTVDPDDPDGTVRYLGSLVKGDKDKRQAAGIIAGWLHIADQWLEREDIASHRAAAGLANRCQTFADVYVNDYQLVADINEAYLLRDINVWREDAFNKSWAIDVVRRSFGGFYNTKQFDKALAVCEFEIRHEPSAQQRDSARVQMAKAYRAAGKYAEAIRSLEEIAPESSLAGVKLVIPEIQKQLDEQQAKQAKPQTKD
jgi:hypothetical protein